MPEQPIAIRERLEGARAVLGLLVALMVIARAPVVAQTQTPRTQSPLQQLEARVTEQQATVDQLKKDYTVSNQIERVSTQVEALRTQLDALEAANEGAKGISTVPAAAWRTLTIIGGLFVVAWGVVSWWRESTAQSQADANKTAASSDFEKTKVTQAAATERLNRIAKLIEAETQGMTPAEKVDYLKNLTPIVDRIVAGACTKGLV